MWPRAERLIADLLAKYLGAYIRDFAHQRLKIGVWSGNLQLEAFEITPDALDVLGLPLLVSRSRIGRLSLQVPWSRLLSEPVVLVVEDIDVELRLKETGELDGRQHERRERMRKRMRLDYAELTRHGADGSRGPRPPEAGGSESLLSQLAARLVNNTRVQLRNVHVRYTHAGPRPFRCGVQLRELSVCAANAQWEPAVIAPAGGGVGQPERRVVELSCLELYCQPAVGSAPAGPILRPLSVRVLVCTATQPRPPSCAREGGGAPADGQEQPGALSDGDGEDGGGGAGDCGGSDEGEAAADAASPRDGAPSAWTCAHVRVREVSLSISSEQSAQLARLSAKLAHLALLERYGRFRPAGAVHDDARGWWRYAAHAVLSDRERHRRRYNTWTALAKRRAVREEYTEKWAARLAAMESGAAGPPAHLASRLVEMEEELQVEDVLFFRALAEHKHRRAAAARPPGARAADGGRPWLGRLLGEQRLVAAADSPPPPPRTRSASAGLLDAMPSRAGLLFGGCAGDEPVPASEAALAAASRLGAHGLGGALPAGTSSLHPPPPPPSGAALLPPHGGARLRPLASSDCSVSESDGEGAAFEDALDALPDVRIGLDDDRCLQALQLASARGGGPRRVGSPPPAASCSHTGASPSAGAARVTEREREELRSALDGCVTAQLLPSCPRPGDGMSASSATSWSVPARMDSGAACGAAGGEDGGWSGVVGAGRHSPELHGGEARRARPVLARTRVDIAVDSLQLALLDARRQARGGSNGGSNGGGNGGGGGGSGGGGGVGGEAEPVLLALLACAGTRALLDSCADGSSRVQLTVPSLELRDCLSRHAGAGAAAANLLEARHQPAAGGGRGPAALRLISASAPGARCADGSADVATDVRLELAPLRLLAHVRLWARLVAAFSAADESARAEPGAAGSARGGDAAARGGEGERIGASALDGRGDGIVELEDEVRAINALSSLSARARAKLELLLRPELRDRTSVRVTAFSPLLVLPADVRAERAEWLSVEMDSLTLTSQPRALDAAAVDELAAACGGGSDGCAYGLLLLSEVYAHSQIAVANATVFVDYARGAPSGGAPRNGGKVSEARQRECVVLPFCARVHLETCVLSADHTLPRTRASVDVPRIDVELSAAALARLARIVRAVAGLAAELDGSGDGGGDGGGGEPAASAAASAGGEMAVGSEERDVPPSAQMMRSSSLSLSSSLRAILSPAPAPHGGSECAAAVGGGAAAAGGARPGLSRRSALAAAALAAASAEGCGDAAAHGGDGSGGGARAPAGKGELAAAAAADPLACGAARPGSAESADGWLPQQLLLQAHLAIGSAGLRVLGGSAAMLVRAELGKLGAELQQRAADSSVALSLQRLSVAHGPLAETAALTVTPRCAAERAQPAEGSEAPCALHLSASVAERECSADLSVGVVRATLDPSALARVLLELHAAVGPVEAPTAAARGAVPSATSGAWLELQLEEGAGAGRPGIRAAGPTPPLALAAPHAARRASGEGLPGAARPSAAAFRLRLAADELSADLVDAQRPCARAVVEAALLSVLTAGGDGGDDAIEAAALRVGTAIFSVALPRAASSGGEGGEGGAGGGDDEEEEEEECMEWRLVQLLAAPPPSAAPPAGGCEESGARSAWEAAPRCAIDARLGGGADGAVRAARVAFGLLLVDVHARAVDVLAGWLAAAAAAQRQCDVAMALPAEQPRAAAADACGAPPLGLSDVSLEVGESRLALHADGEGGAQQLSVALLLGAPFSVTASLGVDGSAPPRQARFDLRSAELVVRTAAQSAERLLSPIALGGALRTRPQLGARRGYELEAELEAGLLQLYVTPASGRVLCRLLSAFAPLAARAAAQGAPVDAGGGGSAPAAAQQADCLSARAHVRWAGAEVSILLPEPGIDVAPCAASFALDETSAVLSWAAHAEPSRTGGDASVELSVTGLHVSHGAGSVAPPFGQLLDVRPWAAASELGRASARADGALAASALSAFVFASGEVATARVELGCVALGCAVEQVHRTALALWSGFGPLLGGMAVGARAAAPPGAPLERAAPPQPPSASALAFDCRAREVRLRLASSADVDEPCDSHHLEVALAVEAAGTVRALGVECLAHARGGLELVDVLLRHTPGHAAAAHAQAARPYASCEEHRFLGAPAALDCTADSAGMLAGAVDVTGVEIQCGDMLVLVSAESAAALGEFAQLVALALAQVDLSWLPVAAVNPRASERLELGFHSLEVVMVDCGFEPAVPLARVALGPVGVRLRDWSNAPRAECALTALLSADAFCHVRELASGGAHDGVGGGAECARWRAQPLFARWPVRAQLGASGARVQADEPLVLTISPDVVRTAAGTRAAPRAPSDGKLPSGDVLVNSTGAPLHARVAAGAAPVLVADGASASLAPHATARGGASPVGDVLEVWMAGYEPIRLPLALGSTVVAITRRPSAPGGERAPGAGAGAPAARDWLYARCSATPGGRTLLLASAFRVRNLTGLALEISVSSGHYADQLESTRALADSASFALPPHLCAQSNRLRIGLHRAEPERAGAEEAGADGAAIVSLDPALLDKLAAQPASEVRCGDHTFRLTPRCEVHAGSGRRSWALTVEAPLTVTNCMPCAVAVRIGEAAVGRPAGAVLGPLESLRVSSSSALRARAVVALSTEHEVTAERPVALLSSARSGSPLEALPAGGRDALASQGPRAQQPASLAFAGEGTLGVQEEASRAVRFLLPSGTCAPSLPMSIVAEGSATGSLHLRLAARLCVLNHTGLALEYLCEDEAGTSAVPVSGRAGARVFRLQPWAGLAELLRTAPDAGEAAATELRAARSRSARSARQPLEHVQVLRVGALQDRMLLGWRLRGCRQQWSRLAMPCRAGANGAFSLRAEDGSLHNIGAALRHLEGTPPEMLTLLLSPRVVLLNRAYAPLRFVRSADAAALAAAAAAAAAASGGGGGGGGGLGARGSESVLPACTPAGRSLWVPLGGLPIGATSSLLCRLEGLDAAGRASTASGSFEVVVDAEPAQPRHCTLRLRDEQGGGGRDADPGRAVLIAMTTFALPDFATTAVVFSSQQPGAAPYQLCNGTPHALRFRQRLRGSVGDERRWESLAPFGTIEYAWDEPLARPRVLEVSSAPSDDVGVQGGPASSSSSSSLLSVAAAMLVPSRAHGAPQSVFYSLDNAGAVAYELPVAQGASLVAELRYVGAVRCLHLTVAPPSSWPLSRRLLGDSVSDASRRSLARSGLRNLLVSPALSSWGGTASGEARWEVLVSVGSVHAHLLAEVAGPKAPVGPGVADTDGQRASSSAPAAAAARRGSGAAQAVEIIYAFASGLTLSWTGRAGGIEDIEANLRHAQVDCELVPCTHPVILRRSHAGPDPLVHLRVRLIRPAAASIGALNAPVVVEEASMRAQQLELCLELQVLSALARLVDGTSAGDEAGASCAAHVCRATPDLLLELERLRRSGAVDNAIYVESLTIHSLRINLTVQLDLNPRGDSLDAPVRRRLISAFGKSGASQQRAPLRLHAFRVVNSLQRPQALLEALARHFGRGVSDELLFKLAVGTFVRPVALLALSRHSYILPQPRTLPDPPVRIMRAESRQQTS